YVQPSQIFNRLEQTDTTQKAPFRRLYDIETESADQEFVHKALSLLKDGNFTDFFRDIQPDNPLYRQLTDHYLQTQNPET
ncbi:L,D-transpeptidase, partial [Xanthomonas citri pv. citri]|nr:L,D-transpeptidase [Xanthomonas citri pv. citri]